MSQFLGESIILSSLSAPLALFLAELLLPTFNELVQKHLEVGIESNPWVTLIVMALVLSVGIISGCYPAFYLSSFQPSEVLRTMWRSSGGGINIRKVLVVAQFSAAIAMVAGTLIIRNQVDFIRTKELGFKKACPPCFDSLSTRSARSRLLSTRYKKKTPQAVGRCLSFWSYQ